MYDAESTTQKMPFSKEAILATELTPFVTPNTLHTNFLNYPEIQLHLSGEQLRKVGAIKNTLLQIPLIHSTINDFPENDLLPSNELPPDSHSNTKNIDKSLGLNKYVFFNWALPEDSGLGNKYLLINPSLLQSPNTIVTPVDLVTIGPTKNMTYQELPDDMKKDFEIEYFKKMVSGRHWLEIIARRILTSIEGGEPFYMLKDRHFLGEIKHLGKVDKNFIEQIITVNHFPNHYKFLYDHGFSIDDLEYEKDIAERTGKRPGAYLLPEECGIDYDLAKRYWSELLK